MKERGLGGGVSVVVTKAVSEPPALHVTTESSSDSSVVPSCSSDSRLQDQVPPLLGALSPGVCTSVPLFEELRSLDSSQSLEYELRRLYVAVFRTPPPFPPLMHAWEAQIRIICACILSCLFLRVLTCRHTISCCACGSCCAMLCVNLLKEHSPPPCHQTGMYPTSVFLSGWWWWWCL